jgi:ribosomal protein S18 acetylase RimI-like enzyme
MAPAVRLVTMSPDAFSQFHDRLVREYATDKVAAGNWPEQDSLERSEAEIRGLLADGLATPDHQVWTIEDDAGRAVGDLWAATHVTRSDTLYIYDIEVRPEARGRGIGEAALRALETWARVAGYRRIGLQVFGTNQVARRLYARTGYVETNVLMEKAL